MGEGEGSRDIREGEDNHKVDSQGAVDMGIHRPVADSAVHKGHRHRDRSLVAEDSVGSQLHLVAPGLQTHPLSSAPRVIVRGIWVAVRGAPASAAGHGFSGCVLISWVM